MRCSLKVVFIQLRSESRLVSPVTHLVYEVPNWRLTTGAGEEQIYDIVISATGVLHHPVNPEIEGLDSFAGHCFHSARWDSSVNLEGQRVGIIGTGSTSAQIVGEITDKVDQMFVFQRTPQWMIPLPQKKYSKTYKRLMKMLPFLMRLGYRYYYEMMVRNFGAATVGDKDKQAMLSRVCSKNPRENIADPELRAKLTPDYQAACKRLIFCTDFYPAISRDNAHLITDAIERITPEGVQTSDGAPRVHRGVAVPGFPNFWLIEGPTGPVGNLSLITVSEHQLDYVIGMLDKMKADGLAAIAANEAAFDDYNEKMHVAIQSTIWVTGGCTSWYMDSTGTPNLYPWPPEQYLTEMHHPYFAEYRLLQGVEVAEPVEADQVVSN